MYGKYFSSTFTGSMVGAGSNVFAVWGYVIANCRNGSIELNPKLLAMILGDEEDSVQAAIDYLCSPDPNSRSKNNDGRRLIKTGPFLFDVPNHASYRKILNEDERRAYFRDKKREQRQKAKALTVGHVGQSKTVQDMSTVSTQSEAESKTSSSSSEGERFVTWFKSLLPEDQKLTGNWESNWRKVYDDMIRLDRRSKEDIKCVCQWARSDSFWKANFLSPLKLRDKTRDGTMYFDVFKAKMESERIPKTGSNGTGPKIMTLKEAQAKQAAMDAEQERKAHAAQS